VTQESHPGGAVPTKFQVFLSSTYDDLHDEREQVIKAILEMGHFPVGMEMFSAADEEQWNIIARQIEQSDYYVVLCAHRYGSIVDGVSYTEKEFDYAVKCGVPVLGFIVDDTVNWAPEFIDHDDGLRAALTAFKEKLRRKPVGTWTTPEHLYGLVSIALGKTFAAQPRPGWVRATETVGPEVLVELSRLSTENASLKRNVDELRASAEEASNPQKIWDILRNNRVSVRMRYRAGDWETVGETTLLELFRLLAPEMAVEKTVASAARDLAVYYADREKDEKPDLCPHNWVRARLLDLMALGLVEPSTKRHPVADTDEYWSTTDLGLEVLHFNTRRRLAMGESTPSPPGDDQELDEEPAQSPEE
jgi:hypothetical protein